MDVLIIKPQYGSKILAGEKLLEIRGSRTNKRGRIGIAYSKTSHVYGEVNLRDIICFTEETWEQFRWAHLVNCSFAEICQTYRQPYGWIMTDPVLYEKPKRYYHPAGAVIWVSNPMLYEEDD